MDIVGFRCFEWSACIKEGKVEGIIWATEAETRLMCLMWLLGIAD